MSSPAFSIPVIESCTPTSWSWPGDAPSYRIEFDFAINDIPAILFYSQITDSNFTATLPFPAGTAVNSWVTNIYDTIVLGQNSTNTIQDSGNHGCYINVSESDNTAECADPNGCNDLAWGDSDFLSGTVQSCMETPLTWFAGEPPFTAVINSIDDNTNILTSFILGPLNTRNLTLAIPFSQGVKYSINVNDNTETNSIYLEDLVVAPGGPSGCIFRPALPQDTASSSSPGSTPTATPSSTPTPHNPRHLGQLIGPIIGGLAALCIPLALFIILRRQQRRRREADVMTHNLVLSPIGKRKEGVDADGISISGESVNSAYFRKAEVHA